MLDGKRIVVTGGSMGIGLACAEEIVARGGRVLVFARGAKDVDAAVARLNGQKKGSATGVHGDVTKDKDIRGALSKIVKEFGGLEGVVHSAGIYGPIGPVTKVDPDKWFEAIRVNLLGTMMMTRAASQHFIEHKTGGSIALMAGGGAATPFPNYTAYACGKAGVVRFTETIAMELAGTNIRVNCIAPGFVITRLHQETLAAGAELAGAFVENTKKQIASGGVPPTVAAKAAAFLMSDRSAKITGRFLAAPYDDYEKWPDHEAELAGSELFTLRRLVPRDRGKDWQ